MGGSELMRFKGKVAVITAAASGICRAAAGIIAKEGGVAVSYTHLTLPTT